MGSTGGPRSASMGHIAVSISIDCRKTETIPTYVSHPSSSSSAAIRHHLVDLLVSNAAETKKKQKNIPSAPIQDDR